MSKLIKLAIKNRTLTFFTVFLLFALGVYSYLTIPQNEDPKVEVRAVQITTYWPGATPEDVELYVTKPIEKACSLQDNTKTVSSESLPGVSVIGVDISEYISTAEVRTAMLQIRNYVNDARGNLPSDVQGPFVNDRFGETTAFVIGLASEKRTRRELEAMVEQLQERILPLDGVGETEIIGAVPEKIFIEGSMQYIGALGITPDVLYSSVQEQNVQIAQPYLRLNGKNILMEVTGKYTSVSQIPETVVYTDDDGRVYKLKDGIGSVNVAYEDPVTQKVRANDEKCVVLGVSMKRGYNIVDWGATIRKVIEDSRKDMPADVNLLILSDQAAGVDRAVDNFMDNFFQAVAVVLLVIGIGVGIRNGMVVALAIPLIIMATFAVMKYLLKTELQQMSINALIISLGMLVDNCVVITDNIKRFVEMGYDKEDAAYLATKEMAVPLFSATLTTLAAFLPLALMPGSTGEYIKDIPYVISCTLFISYLVAMFVTPATSVQFLPSTEKLLEKFEASRSKKPNIIGIVLANLYRKLIDTVIRYKYLALLCILGVLIATMYVARGIPVSFFPPAEKTQFVMDLWLPEGYNLEASASKGKIIEDELMKLEKQGIIDNYVTYQGFGGPRFFIAIAPVAPREYYCQFVMNTGNPKNTDIAYKHMSKFVKNIPGARIDVNKLLTGPPVSIPIEIKIFGKDIDLLREYADQVKEVLRNTPGVTTVSDTFGIDSDKLVIHVDQDKAKMLGLSSEDIATGFYVAFEGYKISELKAPERQIDIVLRLRDQERKGLDDVKAMLFTSKNTGKKHRLDEFATLSLEKQISTIQREKQIRRIVVQAQVQGRLAAEVLKDADPKLNKILDNMKPGFFYEFGGEAKASGDAFGDLIPLGAFAFLLLLLILAFQFKSLRIALSIYLTIPLGAVGAVIGMLVMKQPLGFMSALGLIALAGVVVNNAIVMVEFVLDKLRDGQDLNDAIKEAGIIRFRPIMLTTISTLVGLLPLAIQGGPLFQPMCWVIIFGLSMSTILTLVIVPVYFVALGGDKDALRLIANEREKDDEIKPIFDVEEENVQDEKIPEGGKEVSPKDNKSRKTGRLDE